MESGVLDNGLTPDIIREALEKIVNSESFARSERARDLLRYLVEKDLAGESDRLKGFSIGIDVFDKGADFDPSTDAVVRVQAGRMRQLIEQYYNDEANDDRVRIEIPRGTYVPVYHLREIAKIDDTSTTPPPNDTNPQNTIQFDSSDERPHHLEGLSGLEIDNDQPNDLSSVRLSDSDLERIDKTHDGNFDLENTLQRIEKQQDSAIAKPLNRHINLMWVGMALIIAMLVVLVYLRGPSDDAPLSASNQSNMTIEQLPVVYLHAEGDTSAVKNASNYIREALPRFDAIKTSLEQNSKEVPSPTDYILRISPSDGENGVRLSIENSARKTVIWSSKILQEQGKPTLDQQVANLLTVTMSDDGVIYGDIESHNLETPLTHCLLLNSAYFKKQDDDTHKAAIDCFIALRDAGDKSPIVYAELAVLMLEAVTDYRGHPENASEDEALALAKRAVALGPQSPFAHRAMGYVLSRTGNAKQAIRWSKKAYELNPNDFTLAASYGYALVLTAGDYKEGAKVLERAVNASSSYPDWWIYALFNAHYMNGDKDKAFQLIDYVATSQKSPYMALRLIAADQTNDEATRIKLIESMKEKFPKYSADPIATYNRAKYPDDLAKTLADAVKQAGLKP